jgi:hypothetical protein
MEACHFATQAKIKAIRWYLNLNDVPVLAFVYESHLPIP